MPVMTVDRDAIRSRLLRTLQKAAGVVGVGIVHTEDPHYVELCEIYQRIGAAHRRGDFASIAATFDRDYRLYRMDDIILNRKETENALRARLADQVSTDYREEPAHIIIRGKTAQVASRIFAKTRCRKDGKLMDLVERGEHITIWEMTTVGWKRTRTKMRSHTQNIEWVPEPVAVAATMQKITS